MMDRSTENGWFRVFYKADQSLKLLSEIFFTPQSRFLFCFFVGISMTTCLAQNLTPVNSEQRQLYELSLMEFVDPRFRGSMLHDTIRNGMSEQFNYRSEEGQKTKELAAKLYGSALKAEQRERLLDQSTQFLWMQKLGGGSRELLKGKANLDKTLNEMAKAELYDAQLETEKVRMEAARELRSARKDNYIQNMLSKMPNAASLKSGEHLNSLLESMYHDLLKHGYTLEKAPEFKEEIERLVIQVDDFDKLQLRASTEGNPTPFVASKGIGAVDSVPGLMRHPSILAVTKEVESELKKLSSMAPEDPLFYQRVQALPVLLDRLDSVCDEAVGTKYELVVKESAKGLAKWEAMNVYRSRLRGIADRLMLEGSPEILQSRGKYDYEFHGNKLLTFATFLASNAYRFAEAKPGDEPAYSRMYQSLIRLKGILEM